MAITVSLVLSALVETNDPLRQNENFIFNDAVHTNYLEDTGPGFDTDGMACLLHMIFTQQLTLIVLRARVDDTIAQEDAKDKEKHMGIMGAMQVGSRSAYPGREHLYRGNPGSQSEHIHTYFIRQALPQQQPQMWTPWGLAVQPQHATDPITFASILANAVLSDYVATAIDAEKMKRRLIKVANLKNSHKMTLASQILSRELGSQIDITTLDRWAPNAQFVESLQIWLSGRQNPMSSITFTNMAREWLPHSKQSDWFAALRAYTIYINKHEWTPTEKRELTPGEEGGWFTEVALNIAREAMSDQGGKAVRYTQSAWHQHKQEVLAQFSMKVTGMRHLLDQKEELANELVAQSKPDGYLRKAPSMAEARAIVRQLIKTLPCL